MAKKVRTVYREPEDFIPEKVRRELKLGEFAQGEEEKKDEKPEGSECKRRYVGPSEPEILDPVFRIYRYRLFCGVEA